MHNLRVIEHNDGMWTIEDADGCTIYVTHYERDAIDYALAGLESFEVVRY